MRPRRPPRPPSRSAAELLQHRGGRLPRAPQLSSPTPAVEPRVDLQRLRFTRARTACPRCLRLRRVPPLFAVSSPSGCRFPIPPSGGRESRAGSWSPAALGLAGGGTSGTRPPIHYSDEVAQGFFVFTPLSRRRRLQAGGGAAASWPDAMDGGPWRWAWALGSTMPRPPPTPLLIRSSCHGPATPLLPLVGSMGLIHSEIKILYFFCFEFLASLTV
jgi:hypothetical protein